MADINRFDQRLENLPSGIWARVARIDELKGRFVAGAELGPQALKGLRRSVLVTSSGASTRIEGAKLSDEDVEKMMRGIDIVKFANRDKQEVQGYFELLQNVFASWEDLSLSEGTIKHFHQELLKYVEKDKLHRGEYKHDENKVEMINEAGESVGLLFDTTPAYLTPKEMLELVEWTQGALEEKRFHTLLIIGNFLVEFLNIHPFTDGNGRLSRILTNVLLVKAGYAFMPYVSHEKLVEGNKPDYYLALRSSQRTFKAPGETVVPWLDFFLAVLLKQAQTAVDLLSAATIERTLSTKQIVVWQYLQSKEEATPGEVASQTGVPRPTVNQALGKLVRLKMVEKIGLGRATRYRKQRREI
ncbi:MAG: Filamentation induced by cAMP protein Fic [Microgenomates group bacterium GW2011_GWA1_48_10]|nr:MAG: Filamentation induced by cAMP protein Fic [Microgenomates group bacterium GW2011_GWA1_48_10]